METLLAIVNIKITARMDDDSTVERHLIIGILLHLSVPKKSQAYNVHILYFHPLKFSRHKRSVATLMFNIKERGLVRYISWATLG